MVSITDVLALDVFKDAQLVAGVTGVNREIRWVHIVSMPEAPKTNWTRGGELVLDVGYSLVDNTDEQKTLVHRLVQGNAAALVLSVGHYVDKTPEVMRQDADRLGFPIIEVPGDVLFVDITEAIFTQIVSQQYAIQQKVSYIHHMLTEVVLDGGTLQNLVERLAKYLGKSTTIESAEFEVLADARIGPVDEARRRSIDSGKSTPELIRWLVDTGVYDRLLTHRKSERIPRNLDIGMTMERIVAPIIVSRKIIGYMWIIGDKTDLYPLDDLAIEQAATVAALFMYKEQAVYESRMSMRGDFLNLLLTADGTPDALLESQANNIGFALNRNYQVIILRRVRLDGVIDELQANQIESYLEDELNALVVLRDKQIIVVLQAFQDPDGKRIAGALVEQLATDDGARIVAGVGNTVQVLRQVSNSFEQAREALNIAVRFQQIPNVLAFADLGLLHWLEQIPNDVLEENTYYQAIQHIHNRDSRQKKDLLKSLEAFLQNGGNIKEAAQDLFIHRNTLIYRLERIEAFTQLDLKNPDVQLNLSVALQTFRLRGSGNDTSL